MSSRRRIDVTGGGGSGGGGGPAPTGNFVVGPDFGNPPECQVHAAADLEALAVSGGRTIVVAAANPANAISGGSTVTTVGRFDPAISGGSQIIVTPGISALAVAGGSSAAVAAATPAYAAMFDLSPTASATAALALYEINYLSWADANVTTTSITDAANAIDKNTSTYAYAQAASTSSPLWLTNNTTNFTLVSSFPDFSTPFTTFTIDSVTWEYQFQALRTTGGVQVTEATVNTNIDRSADDGGAYTTEETVSALGALTTRSIDLTSFLDTWTKISQFRSRFTGSVTSGVATGAQSIAQFRIHYSRLRILAHLTNPP